MMDEKLNAVMFDLGAKTEEELRRLLQAFVCEIHPATVATTTEAETYRVVMRTRIRVRLREIEEAGALEREACAKLVDDFQAAAKLLNERDPLLLEELGQLAATIRARGGA